MESSPSHLSPLIDIATSEALIGPDWTTNRQICEITKNQPTTVDELIKVLALKFQHVNPRIVYLALSLTECAMTDAHESFRHQASAKSFLGEISVLVDGSKGSSVQEKSLFLLQQWGMAFAGQRGKLASFHDTFMQLQMQGVIFPSPDSNTQRMTSPLFPLEKNETSPAQVLKSLKQNETNQEIRANQPKKQFNGKFAKLNTDLDTVMEKIVLYRELLALKDTQDIHEALEDVLEFLTQCQPRMNTLIEAGIGGALDETTFERCLDVNDNLVKVLGGEDEKRGETSKGANNSVHASTENLIDWEIPEAMSRVSLNAHNAPPPAPAPAESPSNERAYSAEASSLNEIDQDFDDCFNVKITSEQNKSDEA